MEKLIDLILTMIVTLDDVGGLFLQFTKNDIDNLIKKYKIFDPNSGKKNYQYKKLACNERGKIILWQKKYITNEQFADYMDLEYEDGIFWLVADDFDDILKDKYKTEIEILDGNLDWEPNFYSDYTENDIKSYQWDEYNEDTLNAIIEFCIKKGLEIDDELLTNENTILKDGDIYFNDDRLVDHLDELDELRTSLSISISEAQDSADRDEIYTKVTRAFIKDIGPYKHKNIRDKRPGRNEEKEKLLINLSNIDYDEIADWLKEGYGEYEFIEESYGNLLYILKERDYFEFDTPNYDYIGGDIDKETLNEYTQNRLDWD